MNYCEEYVCKMMEEHMNLVYFITNKFYNQKYNKYNIPYDEFIQNGLIGLWKAIKAFDEDRDIKFSTFASVCIENELKQLYNQEKRKFDKYCDIIDKEYTTKFNEGIYEFINGIYEYDNNIIEDTNILQMTDIMIMTEIIDIINSTFPIKDKRIMILKSKGYKQEQIADILKISQPSVSETLMRNKRKVNCLVKKYLR